MNNKPTAPTFEELCARARLNTDEDWDFVDANLDLFLKSPEVTYWAYSTGIEDVDPNIRDLSATILARCPQELAQLGEERMMEFITDENVFVRHWLPNAPSRPG